MVVHSDECSGRDGHQVVAVMDVKLDVEVYASSGGCSSEIWLDEGGPALNELAKGNVFYVRYAASAISRLTVKTLVTVGSRTTES